MFVLYSIYMYAVHKKKCIGPVMSPARCLWPFYVIWIWAGAHCHARLILITSCTKTALNENNTFWMLHSLPQSVLSRVIFIQMQATFELVSENVSDWMNVSMCIFHLIQFLLFLSVDPDFCSYGGFFHSFSLPVKWIDFTVKFMDDREYDVGIKQKWSG